MDFLNRLRAAQTKNNSLLCVGLDPDFGKLPDQYKNSTTPLWDFNRDIIDATADLVCAYKPNSAFYESRGAEGIEDLKRTCDYLHENHPEIPIILDFKRGDIGNTNEHYASFAFDYLGVDAVTVQPWAGREAVQPFLDRKDKGIIVLDRWSNPGAGEFQDLLVDGQKLYLKVAQNVIDEWNTNGNCLLLAGATAPQEMAEMRQLVGDEMVFLVPGLGAQGGEASDFVKTGVNSQGTGLIINSSRAILFADDPHAAASQTRDKLNQYR
ncbi:MAG TPA: orotidine-5'-phosphate decarboxylase [Candidatus Saccharimonadia bacterium]|nr:orotidine-5'-phosphate decarboxylase [Candidatus Saccharimonadia bacterium]